MTTTLDWKTAKFDLAWQAHRQLGSAMKPFALTAAVEEGANPATTFYTSQPLSIPLPFGQVWNVTTFSHSYAADRPRAGHLAVRQHGLRPARHGPGAAQDRGRGPQDGHPEPPGRLPFDRAGHRGGRRRSRWPTPTPPSPPRASITRRRRSSGCASPTARCVVPRSRQPRRAGRRGLRGRQDPAGQHQLRHRGGHAELLHRHRRRQDRHDRELGRRLVLRLQPQAGHGRLDGLSAGRDPHARRPGRHLLRADLGPLLRDGLRLAAVPDFTQPAKLPVYTPWHGHYASLRPTPTAVPAPPRRRRRRGRDPAPDAGAGAPTHRRRPRPALRLRRRVAAPPRSASGDELLGAASDEPRPRRLGRARVRRRSSSMSSSSSHVATWLARLRVKASSPASSVRLAAAASSKRATIVCQSTRSLSLRPSTARAANSSPPRRATTSESRND